MVSSIFVKFHETVEYFLAVLARQEHEADYLRSHDSQSTLLCIFRQCLRAIQGHMNHQSFDLRDIYELASSCNLQDSTEKAAGSSLLYPQAIDDLLSLLLVDLNTFASLSSDSKAYQQAIKKRALALLEASPQLSPTVQRKILNHILRLMSQDTPQKKNHSESNEGLLVEFLELFASHVTDYSELHALQLTDNDLFASLHVAVSYHQACRYQHQQVSQAEAASMPPSKPLALFIQGLIGYVTHICLRTAEDQSNIHLDHWLQIRFLDQHGQALSPDKLRQVTEAYVSQVEDFGEHLIAHTLYLLEQAPENDLAFPMEDNETPSNSQPSEGNSGKIPGQYGEDEENSDLSILQYATLATSFLEAMRQAQGDSPTANGALWTFEVSSRVLWREFSKLTVTQCNRPVNVGAGDAATVITRQSTATTASPVALNHSAAATDTLWNLTKLHYPVSGGFSADQADIPLLVTTILGLWRHAGSFWDESVVSWLQNLLSNSFPEGTDGGTELRQSLQALILSQLYFPSCEEPSFYENATQSLIGLVLHPFQSTKETAGEVCDPWGAWIQKQLPTRQE